MSDEEFDINFKVNRLIHVHEESNEDDDDDDDDDDKGQLISKANFLILI